MARRGGFETGERDDEGSVIEPIAPGTDRPRPRRSDLIGTDTTPQSAIDEDRRRREQAAFERSQRREAEREADAQAKRDAERKAELARRAEAQRRAIEAKERSEKARQLSQIENQRTREEQQRRLNQEAAAAVADLEQRQSDADLIRGAQPSGTLQLFGRADYQAIADKVERGDPLNQDEIDALATAIFVIDADTELSAQPLSSIRVEEPDGESGYELDDVIDHVAEVMLIAGIETGRAPVRVKEPVKIQPFRNPQTGEPLISTPKEPVTGPPARKPGEPSTGRSRLPPAERPAVEPPAAPKPPRQAQQPKSAMGGKAPVGRPSSRPSGGVRKDTGKVEPPARVRAREEQAAIRAQIREAEAAGDTAAAASLKQKAASIAAAAGAASTIVAPAAAAAVPKSTPSEEPEPELDPLEITEPDPDVVSTPVTEPEAEPDTSPLEDAEPDISPVDTPEPDIEPDATPAVQPQPQEAPGTIVDPTPDTTVRVESEPVPDETPSEGTVSEPDIEPDPEPQEQPPEPISGTPPPDEPPPDEPPPPDVVPRETTPDGTTDDGGSSRPPRPPVRFSRKSTSDPLPPGLYPAAVQFRSRENVVEEVDLTNGRFSTVPESRSQVPKTGSPEDTLRVVKFSRRRPRRRKVDVGDYVATVTSGSIEFELDTGQPNVIREKNRLGP